MADIGIETTRWTEIEKGCRLTKVLALYVHQCIPAVDGTARRVLGHTQESGVPFSEGALNDEEIGIK